MIKIIQADITTLNIDAIVNAANTSLLGGGGVDGAIHRAAGLELLKFNKTLGGCQVGEAKLAPGFNLKANWIIHTVGPVWKGGEQNEASLLESCYINCLELASSKGFKNIAFPAISTGVYGYPVKAATAIAINSMKKYEDRFETIIACCFSAEDKTLYERILTQ
jgi:O-acetyl-ADP-ribose deacetylase